MIHGEILVAVDVDHYDAGQLIKLGSEAVDADIQANLFLTRDSQ